MDLQGVCPATVLPFIKLNVQSSFLLPAQHLSFEPYRQTFWQCDDLLELYFS